ncbi:MAG TPA: helix-turn-helix domain-containing protein [Gemmatimonadales bacterium]|nr:helix-turn-helix domain-containing protein [Gemmatimonadales bacterium]
MTDSASQLSSQKGLRGEILLELKRAQPLTAKQLASKLRVSANAVRHHLKELEADRLIAYGREQRGVGAPTFAYRLSDEGERLFPRAYESTLTELLAHLAERGGKDVALEMFDRHYATLARRLEAELEGVPAERRLEAVARLLSDEGYMAEWSAADGTFNLSEHNCAIRAVAEQYPEVCAAEEKFLQSVLHASVARHAHIPSGCNACQYAITFDAPAARSGGRA